MSSHGKTLLVTGAAGFIGSAVCRHLAGGPWRVVAVDKLTYAGNLSSIAVAMEAPGFSFIRADICDKAAMRRVFSQHDPDAVLHLAAESHVDRSIDAPASFVETNIVGTAALLDVTLHHYEKLDSMRRAHFRFHHVSTDEIYGSLGEDGVFREDTPMDPRSPYSASKAASDHLVSAWGHTYGLPVLVSNCSNNYGPFQLCEKFMPLAILNALDGRPVPVYGDGLNIRDWLFVEDHVEALLMILDKGMPGRRYNVGGRAERTNLSVAQAICDLVGKRLNGHSRRELITFVDDRPGHDRRYAVDPGRVETELGWRARTSFEAGLEKTVNWYLDNPTWWSPLRLAGHGRERLGLGAASEILT